jgi:hypothetical protein
MPLADFKRLDGSKHSPRRVPSQIWKLPAVAAWRTTSSLISERRRVADFEIFEKGALRRLGRTRFRHTA